MRERLRAAIASGMFTRWCGRVSSVLKAHSTYAYPRHMHMHMLTRWYGRVSSVLNVPLYACVHMHMHMHMHMHTHTHMHIHMPMPNQTSCEASEPLSL